MRAEDGIPVLRFASFYEDRDLSMGRSRQSPDSLAGIVEKMRLMRTRSMRRGYQLIPLQRRLECFRLMAPSSHQATDDLFPLKDARSRALCSLAQPKVDFSLPELSGVAKDCLGWRHTGAPSNFS